MAAPDASDIETMLDAYIETALWASSDYSDESGGDPLDKNYSGGDIAPATLAMMRADVEAFAKEMAAQIDGDWSRAGHDLWLTANHHGAGFWDGDWPEPAAAELTAAAHALGGMDLYVGDDGQIHGT